MFVKWTEYVSGVGERCTRNFEGETLSKETTWMI